MSDAAPGGRVLDMRVCCMRWLAVLGATVVASVVATGTARADLANVLGRVPCQPTQGVLFCQSQAPVIGSCSTSPSEDIPCTTETYDPLVPDTRVPSWDGTPLDVNVTLPEGNDRNLPLIILIHGYLSVKTGLTDNADSGTLRGSLEWAQRGYAVLSYSSRGQGNSCGWLASREGTPACTTAWQHLADFRYETRDTQYLAGVLADAGIVNPQKIGVTGFSWGGGTSLDLATLRNRMMLQNGQLVRWVSPQRHLPMTIAAAAPFAAWSDIPYSAAPNGHMLDYTLTPYNINLRAAPVPKTSFYDGLVAALEAASFFPPPGADPEVALWATEVNAGWPADSPDNASYAAAEESLFTDHSALGLPTNEAPAPTLYANGWNDDIFPVAEELAWVNRERAAHPRTTIAMFLSDIGHPRNQSKAADVTRLRDARFAWFAHYLLGKRTPLLHGVEALTTTCPASQPSGGPYFARSWPAMHPGEVHFDSAAAQTVQSSSGSPSADAQFDPIAGPGVCATASAATVSGTATYDFPVPAGGITMIGSPTVVSTLNPTATPGYPYPSLAAHLLDVAPGGNSETLLARATYRPTAPGRQVFQLYPQAWHFAPGHVIKLELAGQDAPYSAPNSTPGTVAVSNLQLRLPTLQRANCTTILTPAAPVVPPGERLAPGVRAHSPAVCRATRRRKRSSHRSKLVRHGNAAKRPTSLSG